MTRYHGLKVCLSGLTSVLSLFCKNFHLLSPPAASRLPVPQASGVKMLAVIQTTSLVLSPPVSTAALTAVIASGKMRQAIKTTGGFSVNMGLYVMTIRVTLAQVTIFCLNLLKFL